MRMRRRVLDSFTLRAPPVALGRFELVARALSAAVMSRRVFVVGVGMTKVRAGGGAAPQAGARGPSEGAAVRAGTSAVLPPGGSTRGLPTSASLSGLKHSLGGLTLCR